MKEKERGKNETEKITYQVEKKKIEANYIPSSYIPSRKKETSCNIM